MTGATVEIVRDVSAELDCDCCGSPPPGRRGSGVTRRHRVTRPDPETPGLEIVLCDGCAQVSPPRVAELVRLRRAWYVIAWKAGLRPTA